MSLNFSLEMILCYTYFTPTKKDIKLQDYGSFFLKTMRICVPLHPKNI